MKQYVILVLCVVWCGNIYDVMSRACGCAFVLTVVRGHALERLGLSIAGVRLMLLLLLLCRGLLSVEATKADVERYERQVVSD